MTETTKGKLTGRHVAMFIGGLFAVVLTMNITFITLALTSFSGEDTEDAYTVGLAYNETLQDRAAQRELGWHVDLQTTTDINQTVEIRLTLSDRDGIPINDASIAALLRRPTNDGFDRQITLRFLGNGSYDGSVALPLPGVWDLEIDAVRDGDGHFEIEERLWVE